MQGCQRLDQAVMVGRGWWGWGVAVLPTALQLPLPQAVKELQTSTREAIVLLKAMIEEVRNSASEEEAAINSLFGRMQVGVTVPCAHGCPLGGHGRAGVAGGDRGGRRTRGGHAICRSSFPRGRRRS